MAFQKPGIPKGTRDFGPVEMSKRNHIFNSIKSVFLKHGYSQIETPAMENLDTLLGKYGEEGDKLLFKILNSGDFLNGFSSQQILSDGSNAVSLKICEKGLRYDLTVPFARYVVQHQNEIEFPFRRYQIQPVWRADRPQKGRYREFYQCDVDVIGSDSLLNEADLIGITDEVFSILNIKVKIKLNNRKILAGIAEYIGQPDKITDITVAIDKLEKIGHEAVSQELQQRGINVQGIYKLEPLFTLTGNNHQKLEGLAKILENSAQANKGIEEMRYLLKVLETLKINSDLEFDIALARGLNYYTGTIIEVKAKDFEIGSICGGGRYDDLTGIFGLKEISGVGISFGADRIYDVMEHLNLFPAEAVQSSKVLFANFGEKESVHCISLVSELHKNGISAELYPDAVKLKKQMAYADARKIRYVVLVGENEMKEGILTIKNMDSGEQYTSTLEELIRILS
ncbi:MAG TPA: histidine--tRNA ligase [Bacteroidales bacterium]|jgi:histidyl-tRNA synthetase|nr:histidine--tRNA ligase [Bacteroidales bacterium]